MNKLNYGVYTQKNDQPKCIFSEGKMFNLGSLWICPAAVCWGLNKWTSKRVVSEVSALSM